MIDYFLNFFFILYPYGTCAKFKNLKIATDKFSNLKKKKSFETHTHKGQQSNQSLTCTHSTADKYQQTYMMNKTKS